jgi:hypothetical protein
MHVLYNQRDGFVKGGWRPVSIPPNGSRNGRLFRISADEAAITRSTRKDVFLTITMLAIECSQRNNTRYIVLAQQVVESRNVGVQYFLQLL